MPLPVMDHKGFSSSPHSSEDVPFPGERQVGFWKTMPDKNGAAGGTFVSSPQPKLMQVQSWASTSPHSREFFPMQEQMVNLNLGMIAAETETTASRSLASSKPMGHDPVSRYSLSARRASEFAEGGGVTLLGGQHENSLFSSSLSDLFCRKMKLTPNNGFYGHSIGTVASHFEEEEPIESLEEIEAQTIGNLLPDDDELLSGVTDGLGFSLHSKESLEIEEVDIFSTVGGMDLEEYGSSEGRRKFDFPVVLSKNPLESNGSLNGEHPYGEHPSRTLFVRNINSNAEDSELRALFEQFGDIRALYTACKHRGFVMISYYDIRAARSAMKALQNKPLRRRKLDIHYSIPKDNPSEKDINQGTLVVFNLDSSVSNEELHHIFGVYGEIKEVRETPHRSNHKFVEFYDVRAAEAALRELNNSNIAGKQIKLEPSRPGGARRSPLQSSLELEIDEFNLYVKESNSTNNSNAGLSGPHTLGALTSTRVHDILGRRSSIQSSVPESASYHGISSSVPNSLPSLNTVGSVGTHPGLTESRQSLGQLKFDIRPTSSLHPHSVPEYHDAFMHGIHSSSPTFVEASTNARSLERTDRQHRAGSNGCSLEFNESGFGSTGTGTGQYTWGNSYQPPSMMWQNSPSLVSGFCAGGPHALPRLSGLPGAPSQRLNSVMPRKAHHVGSAPSASPLWDWQQAYAGESPKTSTFHQGPLGNNMQIRNNSLNTVEFVPQTIFSHIAGNIDIPGSSENTMFLSHQQRNTMFSNRGQMTPTASAFDPPNERIRSRRNEGASSQPDNKKLFELDVDRIMRGDDTRTTLMIKNIPNKYTSKMLLAAIDECHRGTYDFIYLPIDFKNKCNVGYAFINMTDPKKIIPFYKAFNGKKWEKFNSEKVASITYGRIQGKAALIAHFQNSSLMNEDKRCRPILFNTEGPNAGDQVPFPMGVNVRTRPGKARTSMVEENNQGSRASFTKEEDRSNGDTSMVA